MMRRIVFLDIDDVLCLQQPYGLSHVLRPSRPAGLWERLFHAPAVAALHDIVTEHHPRIVISSNWQRALDRTGIEQVLRLSGLSTAADALHEQWCAPAPAGWDRLWAIDNWLSEHHRGEPYVAIDDGESGWTLFDSSHDRAGRVVFCDIGEGLHSGHLPAVRCALRRWPT